MKHLKKFNEGSDWVPDRKEPAEELECEMGEMYCPYCGCEQAEHPMNVMDGEFGHYECDECGKTFEITTVAYLVTKRID